eukprot:jgi/Orpsp1_1/1184942/evm.model.c7180000091668.1
MELLKKHTPNMENYFIIRTSYAKPSYYLSILYLLTKSLPINKIDWIKTNKIRTFSSSKKLRKNSLKYFNSFRIKTLSSDFIYNSIYSSSSLFFNLCVSWNINGWNTEKRDGIKYFNDIFKPICICLQEVGNSKFLNNFTSSYPFLSQYNTLLRKADSNIPGMRGLYIGVHSSCSFYPDPFEFKYIISVNISSFWGVKCTIGNIYVPTITHKETRSFAISEINNWLKKHTKNPSILVGDFNMTKSQLEALVDKSSQQWYALSLSGYSFTWAREGIKSCIDHILVNDQMNKYINKVSVCTSFNDISDHFPLLLSCKKDDSEGFHTPPPSKRIKWSSKICKEMKNEIYSNNLFSVLYDEFKNNEELNSSEMVNKFIDTANNIGDKIKARVPSDLKGTAFHCPYYINIIESACEDFLNKDDRRAWLKLKKISKPSFSSSSPSYIIKDKTGKYLFSRADQLNRFAEHYEDLASDITSHSLNKDYWEKLFDVHSSNNRTWNINKPIEMSEIQETVSSMKNNKAPGPDGIPIEFFKAFFNEPDSSDSSTSNSSTESNYSDCAKCLLLMFNKIWNGDFPEDWNTASIVSLPKKGDLTDCNNYRGISLINVGLKILSKIVTNRISKYAFKHNFIRPEQFGFRNKEECISLYISIREICQRRKFKNKFTYLAFLDLKKAYDSVPTMNILMKLYKLGIRGKCHRFLSNLYLSSKARACFKSDLSNEFEIHRGVRQGCPLSPILFNLFINDVLDGCDKFGVSIESKKCCGGLFADDIVLVAPSKSALRNILNKVHSWSIKNEMTFGINKCCTLVIKPKNFVKSPNYIDLSFFIGINKIPKMISICALAQLRCFRKWKNSLCIIESLVNNIPRLSHFSWTKECRSLEKKLNGKSDIEIKEFYWERDLFNTSKAKKAIIYKNNDFGFTEEIQKLTLQYPDYQRGFFWISRIRCGNEVSENCPNCCPCCGGSVPSFSQWINSCPCSSWRARSIYEKLKLENGEQRQLVDKIFQSSTESTVPYFVGIAEFLTNIMPFVCQSFKLMMEWYNIRPTVAKSVDVEMIRHGFSPPSRRASDTESNENSSNGVIFEEWEKLEASMSSKIL